jgi:hypothetical protein
MANSSTVFQPVNFLQYCGLCRFGSGAGSLRASLPAISSLSLAANGGQGRSPYWLVAIIMSRKKTAESHRLRSAAVFGTDRNAEEMWRSRI